MRWYAANTAAGQSILGLTCAGKNENDFSALERRVIWVEKQRGGGLKRECGRIMISNRRQREAAHEGTKEGQTEESVWVRSHLPAAFLKAPRREASILYYPSACLPSWRIFHLILVCQNRKLDLQMCPRPFPAVLQPLLLLIKFMRTTATTVWGSGLAPLKSDWFYFHREGRSSGGCIKFKNWVQILTTTQSSRGH